MNRIPLVIALTAAAAFAPAQAQPSPGRGGMFRGAPWELSGKLFAPELVMRHQEDIGLSEDQKSKLVHAIQELQSDLVPLQFEMGEAAGRLRDALAGPRVDEERAGELADRLMDLETRIKRRHLTLMIRIKNVLTPDQQKRLRELREREPKGAGGRRGDRTPHPGGGREVPPDSTD